jgi:hypothetical protein
LRKNIVVYNLKIPLFQSSFNYISKNSCPYALLIKHYAFKAYGGEDVKIHIFLTSALVGGEWSASRPGSFIPGERAPGTHWIGGWVNPRDGLDDLEKRKFLTLPGLKLRPLGRPARSHSLYRLRYPVNYISKF